MCLQYHPSPLTTPSPARLQLLEVLYGVLFLRTSDVDRSGADDQSSPASPGDPTPAPPGDPVPAGAALLLGGPEQTALTELLRQRLTEMRLDGEKPGQERTELARRRDR